MVITLIEVAAIVIMTVYLLGHRKKEEIPPATENTTVQTQPETEASYTSPVDFAALWQRNPDVYAYIKIPGTIIDYPVLQGGPYDDYYLDNTIDHYNGFPGSIYTQASVNSKTFEEFNTVIYGHELADGSMFTPLQYYMDPDFFYSHREVKIYLPDRELTYRVFAEVTYNDMLILYYFNNDNWEDRNAFLNSIYGNGYANDVIAGDTQVTADDHIITLSTCIYDLPSNRCLVLAVKTDEKGIDGAGVNYQYHIDK